MRCTLSFLRQPIDRPTALITPAHRWEAVTSELAGQVHLADFWHEGDGEKLLSIAEVRSLNRFAGLSPVGEGKIACLWAADRYRPETANALLKIIEEPPEYLLIVLLSETDHFLPTVRSRVQAVAVTDDSATMNKSGFPALFASYTLDTEPGREEARQALYLHSLVHGGIKADGIIESLRSSQS
ncbi:hypothetical protein KGQ71_05285 [Patescibacteria group bacterium]|nr:hypothetical protein [Patescibacteria group bacterium]